MKENYYSLSNSARNKFVLYYSAIKSKSSNENKKLFLINSKKVGIFKKMHCFS